MPKRQQHQHGHTTRSKYTDAGQNRDLSGTDYMHDTFEVTSEDYEKFAGLAQKTQQMKK